ncbi:hypothetical protein Lal_00024940 [Lupinus albus]|uniref:Uncharacterized protein n=1 Tax=Lupinus albus TaxID=3870 RepID=A0A6A4PW94_LUPAL|nr:hypothetical protein Lalb_Chr10g0098571 [Lupinus albus]KAF1889613.1 hypothetical protein Lal_00024940 [Lupinus albus]
MGTKVQNLLGSYSMRDLNEEFSSCGWPLLYGDKTPANRQYCNNYHPSVTADTCSSYDKDVVKRTMLEQEAIFKNQVHELHRLYKRQRDLMNEVKRKELHGNQIPVEASCSTDRLASQIMIEDGQKRHISGFPVGNSMCSKTSVSGVKGVNSPLSSIKGISNQGAGLFPSSNGCSSKDTEVLESRPTKVQRKMFDLQLPADAYVDTEESEKLSDGKINGPTLFRPDRNCNNGKESDVKLFCGNGVKTSPEDISRSEQTSKRRNDLADLNEPVQVEETNDSPYIHHPSHNPYQVATECSNPSGAAKQQPWFVGLSREHLHNSNQGTDSWPRKNGYLENSASGKERIMLEAEAGQAKSSIQSVPQALKLEKSLSSSQTMHDKLSKGHEESAYDYLTGRSKTDLWREKTVNGLNFGERNREYSINMHPESVVPLHRCGPFAVSPSTDLSKSWSHSAPSWEMENSSLNQKLMSPCLNASGALSRSSQSHKGNRILDDRWPLNINSKPSSGLRCDVPTQNGFHAGSLSRSKEPSTNTSSTSYDYLNQYNGCNTIPQHSINNGPYNGSNSHFNDSKSRNIDLNVMFSNGSSNNLVSPSCIRIMDGEQKHDEHHAVLPWLRAKTTCKTVSKNADNGISAGESSFSHVASLSHKATSVSCSNDVNRKRTEVGESSSSKKILGVPIFNMPHTSSKDLSSLTSSSISILNPSEVEAVENNRKDQLFDMNLPCDVDSLELGKECATETIVSRERSPTKESNSRNQFDLNLCMSEDEASLMTIPSDNVKMKATIDLESPAVPDNTEDSVPEEKQIENSPESAKDPLDKVERTHDELMRQAAESIVVLSSLPSEQVDGVIGNPSESPTQDPLSWFVDIIFSHKDNHDCKLYNSRGGNDDNEEPSSSDGMDSFEAMTLKLPETKEEDYMPKPFVPENIIVEETTPLPTRTRRGAARRGRQRRDFQRDILPGLASLSRYEVTEDLQTFGGLMKATGSTRRSSSRNGSGRGRRRVQVAQSPPPAAATNETCTPLMQQLNSIEVGLEDSSLTGWGKTTRRPRRQRYPAGNPRRSG